MGICPKRYFMLSICVLQIVTVTQRQVFDFLGFLWIPILINFFDVIFIIFGFFGAFQYRPKYIIVYSLWNLFWLGWNIFLICLYLDIGSLNHKESKVLKIDPDSSSWWEHGPGCRGTLNMTSVVPVWDDVTNCLVDYRYVEVLQAGIQCILAILGIFSGYCLSRLFMEEDDSFNYLGGDGKSPEHLALQPMYVSCNNFNTSSSNHSYKKHDPKPIFSNNSSGENFLIRGHKTNQAVRTDLIRYQKPVYRSYSYDRLRQPINFNKKRKARPQSLHFVDY